MARKTELSSKTVSHLVKIYGASPGGRDTAGEELRRRGAAARDEVIRMLDSLSSAELIAGKGSALFEILDLFPSKKSVKALKKVNARLPSRGVGSSLAFQRAKMNGSFDAWYRSKQESRVERQLQFVEMELANCEPTDRVNELVDAAIAALHAFEEARAANDKRLERINRRKTKTYAREVLRTPDLASYGDESGCLPFDMASNILGKLAVYDDNLVAAGKYLIGSSTPPSGMRPSPDFELAKALLKRDERNSVCQYLDNLRPFAKELSLKGSLIDRWKKRIQAGQIPDFFKEYVANSR
jgi:hypothetical protein